MIAEARFGCGVDSPRTRFPLAIGIPSLGLALLALGLELRGARGPAMATSAVEAEPAEPLRPPEVVRQRTLAMMGWVVGFFLGIWLLGFSLAVPVLTFLYLKLGAGERWPISLALTALGYAFFHGLFDSALHVPFPQGLLFELLG